MAITIHGNGSMDGLSSLPDLVTLPTGLLTAADLPSGTVIQIHHTTLGSSSTGNSNTMVDIAGHSTTFTPQFADSKLYHLLITGFHFNCDGKVRIKRNGTEASPYLQNSYRDVSNTNHIYDKPYWPVQWLDTAHNTTSQITYQLCACATGCGQYYWVGDIGDAEPTWTIMEIR